MKRFHVLSAFVCVICLGLTSTILAENRKGDSVRPDTQAPVISIKNEEDVIQIVQGNEFDLSNYVAVSDNSNEFHLMSYGKVDVDKVDEYTLDLVAIDAGGNATAKTLTVKVITQEEMNELIAQEQQRILEEEQELIRMREEQRAKEIQAMMASEVSSDVSASAYDFALNYIGMGGWCTDVAQAFIDGYFGSGYNIFDTYSVSASEAMPGDIIYYSESGLGSQHYAVYLGGESALHGNFNGTTIIRSIYLDGGSAPQFYRLSGR